MLEKTMKQLYKEMISLQKMTSSLMAIHYGLKGKGSLLK